MLRSLLIPLVLLAVSHSAVAQWAPAKGPLMTRWAKDVSPDKVLPEYPRPQLVRSEWLNLNGLWDYAIRPREQAQPGNHDGKILVPFPVESALSGVMKQVGPDNKLWYRRTFEVPKTWAGKRVLLHFGAVDWETAVTVNGKPVGEPHKGGYDPFTLDITDALNPTGSQELVVAVSDPSDAGTQPRGKQVREPKGIWYTPTTGIWQTVWLEPVAGTHIASIRVTPDIDKQSARIMVTFWRPNAGSTSTRILIHDGAATREFEGQKIIGTVEPNVPLRWREATTPTYVSDLSKFWSPDSPFLYGVTVVLTENDREVDRVTSYFGMRKISLAKDDKGVLRVMFNNQPLFQYGPLDQGFWPDGLYTAPTDEALKYDIEITKKLGFNMARKHVKVEPDRWYYWCDKLGLIVWQDMPSGDKHAAWNPLGKHDNTEMTRSKESSENFNREWRAIIDSLRNHPCIVMWVPFNEGWGQANTVAVTKWTKEYDPTRLVNCASGGNDFPVGDVIDVHRYPGPFAPKPTSDRAAVLGEFGGLGLPVKGHTWQDEKNWGYRSFTSEADLTNAYAGLISKMRPMIGEGLSAAIYTQTTDVEIEVNGLLTYDRAQFKMPVDKVAAINRKLYQPPPKMVRVVPTSQETAIEWKFTTEKPADGWEQAAFDDASWKAAPGGFGEKTTPGSTVRTAWKTPDIWLRRTIEIPAGKLADPHFLVHHDEDSELYIDGVLAAKVSGFITSYLPVPVSDAARAKLTPGKHTLAIHCKQTGGGQYIDAGIIDLVEK